jgi:hypothetical protein
MFLLANKIFIKTCYTSVKASIKIIKTDKENFVPILDEETCTRYQKSDGKRSIFCASMGSLMYKQYVANSIHVFQDSLCISYLDGNMFPS